MNYESLGIMTDDVYEQKEKDNNDIKKVGLRQVLYNKVKHPIMRKVRHVWFIQDFRNRKKYKKWREYYKNYDSIKSE